MNIDPLNNFPVVLYDPKQGRNIPETFVRSGLDEYANYDLFGDDVEITGGFMEPSGHGNKNGQAYVIFENDPNTIVAYPETLIPTGDPKGEDIYANDNYNVGIDYTVNTSDELTKAWYSGEVIKTGLEGSYGNRVHVKTDVIYEFQGKEYDVYTAYAHLNSINVKVGDKVNQGDNLGEMGGTGSGGVTSYDPHVDLQTWIQLDDGRKVNLSPNLIQKQLAERFCKQYGPPTLGVIARQNSLPPGVLESWSGGCTPPPPPYAQDTEDGFEDTEQSGSPLVLDLDGDGIELTAVGKTNVFFDVDGDGFRESSGWVQSDDGLLILDRNNDGYINDNCELFGNNENFKNGFESLAALDTNSDQVIDAADADFSKLQIWRDLDSDGRSDTNELFSLNELEIKNINLNYRYVNSTNAGNQIREVSSYQLTDGTTREIVDAWFTLDQLNSYYDHNSTYNDPVLITEQILNLPNLKGYGNLPDLRIAMGQDAELVALVQSFKDTVARGDITGSRDLILPILYRWAGVDDLDPTSRGAYLDARNLTFLEKFIGRNWANSSDDNLRNPARLQGPNVEAVFEQLIPELEIRLLVQALDSPVDYNTVTESYVFNGSITEAGNQFQQLIAQSRTTPSQKTEFQAISLAQYIRQEEVYSEWILGDIDDQKLTGSASAEELYGFIGNDTLDAGEGNDTLYGGEGDDTLSAGNGINILYAQNGNDSLISGTGEDTLYGDEGDDILKGGRGNDVYYGGDGNDLIEDIRRNYVWYSSYTSDSDTVDGGRGNDTLKAGGGDDVYIFNLGYGNDVISDYSFRGLAYRIDPVASGGTNDTLVFGSDITRNNLTWNFDGQDLTFTFANSPNDSLTIENYYNPFYRIENIQVEGIQLTLGEIIGSQIWRDVSATNSLSWLESAISYQGLAGDDRITTGNYDDQLWGNYGDDVINSGAGNDTLFGNVGNDNLSSEDGDDTVDGGEGDDTLSAGNGINYLVAGDGNDSLISGTGEDILYL